MLTNELLPGRPETSENRKNTRIQARNREKILEAATDSFSLYGYRGATLDQIAAAADMSKPNLLYYFPSKEELYLTVLRNILEIWLTPLRELGQQEEPEPAISAYIDQKMELSRLYPAASRVFANEIAAGAPILKPVLDTYLRNIVVKQARVIRRWIKQGKMAAIDPYHLLMMIWAVTQHYADFAVQIDAVLGKTLDDKKFYYQARKNVKRVLMRGIFEAAAIRGNIKRKRGNGRRELA